MAKKEVEEEISWGTWEELLLACAVKRHGTNNWESVANEINKNSSSNFIVTPPNCKLKYHDLHRRFMSKDIINSDQHNNNIDEKLNHRRIPWLDELRKLRVSELRREVQQYDVSIVSLQLKVKRLKEEREQSLKDDNKNLDVKPDLLDKRTKEEEEAKEIDTESLRIPSPIQKTDKPVSVGGESDREDNQSFNESNSSNLKHGKNPEVEVEKIPEPVESVTEKHDVDKPLGEDSCNGSSDTVAKDSVVKKLSEKTIPVSEPVGLWESVAESKGGGNVGGGEEGTKENSDVQSSASLSKRNRRRRTTSGSSSSGEERETDEVSPAIKQISVKSEPLLGYLEMVLCHKYGSVFKSRLESQQTSKYKGLIRQHIDMETIQTRLKEGSYSGSCSQKFFRDLLLVFNNAIAVYPKHSSESNAATELRELVSKEILSRSSGSSSSRSQNNPSPGEAPTPKLQQSATPPLLKPDPELSDSLLPKSKSVGALSIACRKRSSISAKAANSSKPVELKGSDQKIAEEKQKENSSALEEKIVFSRRTGERSASGTRSSRSNFKNRNNNITNKNSSKNTNSNSKLDPSSAPKSAKGGSGDGDETNLGTMTEKDKKNNNNNSSTVLTNTVAKKRSVGDVKEFLNRMKKTSSSSNDGKLLETLKNSAAGNNSNTTRGEKGGSNKGEKHRGSDGSGSKKDGQVTRQSSSKRRGSSQESSPSKRGVGRPPKKALQPSPSSSKTTREREKEVEPEVRPPRKRTRR